jgi:hypothetical protein
MEKSMNYSMHFQVSGVSLGSNTIDMPEGTVTGATLRWDSFDNDDSPVSGVGTVNLPTGTFTLPPYVNAVRSVQITLTQNVTFADEDNLTVTASATALAAGAIPTVTASKPAAKTRNFLFGIPKGDKGDKGDQGPAGVVASKINTPYLFSDFLQLTGDFDAKLPFNDASINPLYIAGRPGVLSAQAGTSWDSAAVFSSRLIGSISELQKGVVAFRLQAGRAAETKINIGLCEEGHTPTNGTFVQIVGSTATFKVSNSGAVTSYGSVSLSDNVWYKFVLTQNAGVYKMELYNANTNALVATSSNLTVQPAAVLPFTAIGVHSQNGNSPLFDIDYMEYTGAPIAQR